MIFLLYLIRKQQVNLYYFVDEIVEEKSEKINSNHKTERNSFSHTHQRKCVVYLESGAVHEQASMPKIKTFTTAENFCPENLSNF